MQRKPTRRKSLDTPNPIAAALLAANGAVAPPPSEPEEKSNEDSKAEVERAMERKPTRRKSLDTPDPIAGERANLVEDEPATELTIFHATSGKTCSGQK